MLIYGNRPSKMKLFWCQEIFFGDFDIINGCENEFEHNNEDYAAALEKRSLTKSILQPLGLTSPIRQRGSYGQI